MTRPAYPSTRLVLAIATALAAAWTAGVVAAPWLATHDSAVGTWLRLVYRPGCHQIADRCLDLGFGPLAVCARCFGLYLGGTAGLSVTLARGRSGRPRPWWLAVASAPTALDWLLGQLGLPNADNWTRFALAVPPGLVAGLFLGDALVEIVRRNTAPGPQQTDPDSLR
jgi:uncharacterized membrane protein